MRHGDSREEDVSAKVDLIANQKVHDIVAKAENNQKGFDRSATLMVEMVFALPKFFIFGSR